MLWENAFVRRDSYWTRRGFPLPSRVKKNIVLIGDGGVGKTSLVRRFVLDKFSDDYVVTVGAKVTKKEVDVEHRGEGRPVTLMIWDILGQKGYSRVQSSAFESAEAAMVVSDVTRVETLKSLSEYWIPSLFDVSGQIPIVFLANKSDLSDEAEFGLEELEATAAVLEEGGAEVSCRLTSAKTGKAVPGAFMDVARLVVEAGERSADRVKPGALNNIKNLVDATDFIISDFCTEFGGVENAMPIIKHQFNISGVSVVNPSREGLLDVVERLAAIERDFKPDSQVNLNKHRRVAAINTAEG